MTDVQKPPELNCALTHYLEEASAIDSGGKSAFANAMLADLGYLNKNFEHPGVGNLNDLLGILIKCGYKETLSEMSNLCRACSESSACLVGAMVLKS